MNKEAVTALFDQQASSYDRNWSKTAPIHGALHWLSRAVLGRLPAESRILCVGAGTGAEILFLAQAFPKWHFMAAEPSTAMLEVCRSRAQEAGIISRCSFHCGYLESLPPSAPFDAATSFLVSQFISDRQQRTDFFRDIAARLGPNGILISSDLAGDVLAPEFDRMLEVWFRATSGEALSVEGIARMRTAYTRDVAVLPPHDVSAMILHGGFESPVPFYQAGLIHAWYASRSAKLPLPRGAAG